MEDKKIIINIGRQIGSGGRIIARQLAEQFGCKFYDKELLNLAAKESGFCEKFFEQNDEHKGFLRSLFHIHGSLFGESPYYKNELTMVRNPGERITVFTFSPYFNGKQISASVNRKKRYSVYTADYQFIYGIVESRNVFTPGNRDTHQIH